MCFRYTFVPLYWWSGFDSAMRRRSLETSLRDELPRQVRQRRALCQWSLSVMERQQGSLVLYPGTVFAYLDKYEKTLIAKHDSNHTPISYKELRNSNAWKFSIILWWSMMKVVWCLLGLFGIWPNPHCETRLAPVSVNSQKLGQKTERRQKRQYLNGNRNTSSSSVF